MPRNTRQSAYGPSTASGSISKESASCSPTTSTMNSFMPKTPAASKRTTPSPSTTSATKPPPICVIKKSPSVMTAYAKTASSSSTKISVSARQDSST
jgi:hypothetical protein